MEVTKQWPSRYICWKFQFGYSFDSEDATIFLDTFVHKIEHP